MADSDPAIAAPVHDRPRLFCGDCRQVARQLDRAGERFDLVFGDPPFNIGHPYAEHDDRQDPADFTRFMAEWLDGAVSLLSPTGLLAVHAPDELALVVIRHLAAMEQAHWINWHFRFGQAGPIANARKYTTSKAHLLVWCRPGAKERTTFNPQIVSSDRATKYNDRRTRETATPGLRVAFDVWGLDCDGPHWGRVPGNSRERWDTKHGALVDHPNQLPERYLERVVNTYSNPGDRMLVMFGGSGTEMVVGHALGRDVTGVEIGPIGCQSIIRRLARGPVRSLGPAPAAPGCPQTSADGVG